MREKKKTSVVSGYPATEKWFKNIDTRQSEIRIDFLRKSGQNLLRIIHRSFLFFLWNVKWFQVNSFGFVVESSKIWMLPTPTAVEDTLKYSWSDLRNQFSLIKLIKLISALVTHQIFCSGAIGLNASRDWIFPNFQNCGCCEKYLKDNKHNSLHLTLKICSNICPWTLSVP